MISTGSILLSPAVLAREHSMNPVTKGSHVMLMPADLKWNDGRPDCLRELGLLSWQVMLYARLFTLRLKFPANYSIPAHWYPTDEHIKVISGTFSAGMGEKTDSKSVKSIIQGATL